jgi:uncharacterized protein (DUF2062 family)
MLFKRRNKLSIFEKIKNFIIPPTGFKRAYKYIFKRILRIKGSSHSIAIGFACGIAIIMIPAIGLQIPLTILTTYLLKGNIIASLIATSFGNPLTFPFIWFISYKIGATILDYKATSITINTENIINLIIPIFTGGIILAFISGFLTYFIIKKLIEKKDKKI